MGNLARTASPSSASPRETANFHHYSLPNKEWKNLHNHYPTAPVPRHFPSAKQKDLYTYPPRKVAYFSQSLSSFRVERATTNWVRKMSEESKRRSGGSLVALDDRKPSSVSVMGGVSGKKVSIKSADMKEDMQKEAVEVAIDAFEKSGVEKDVAEYIKKVFDKKYGPTWHCIVGKNFGSYVTHETNYFIYFYLESKAVLLFKSG